jgi:amino acid transporter
MTSQPPASNHGSQVYPDPRSVATPSGIAALARKLRVTDYFTLGFGTMVGVGWLVVMDDWLARGGPVGAVLGFAIGGALLLPIGYVYGQLVKAMPDASAEVAYTAQVFPKPVSFATGWMMLLAYLIVCPWEAVAVGKIAAYIFPGLDNWEMYRIAGQPVFLPRVLLGAALLLVLAVLNYRGIRLSATFQNWTTFAVFALFGVLVACGAARGTPGNLLPPFRHAPWVSVLLVLQVVPYFMTGFESVGKSAEEAHPEFRSRGFFLAMVLAILVGALFYVLAIAAVGFVSPWPALVGRKFATAVAFERAFGSRWIVNLLLLTALLSLFRVFNGNFVASSRLLFALGRRGLVNRRLGFVHPGNHTPSIAILWIALATLLGLLLGDAILIPITEVGSLASALGWLAACAAYLWMRPSAGKSVVAVLGIAAALAMALMKFIPAIPGHFSVAEYVALGLWALLGLLLNVAARKQKEAPATSAAGI